MRWSTAKGQCVQTDTAAAASTEDYQAARGGRALRSSPVPALAAVARAHAELRWRGFVEIRKDGDGR